MKKQTVWFQDLGQMAYKAAWEYQEKLMQENLRIKASAWNRIAVNNDEESKIKNGENGFVLSPETANLNTAEDLPTQHYLLFVEHPPVYTLGKSGKMEHVLIGEMERMEKGIDFYHTNRGGDITFHGPAQLVGYPILDLEKFYKDIGRYLRDLEEVIIRTLSYYGIVGGRSAGETGVWIGAAIKGSERKICAMGVRCSRWITMHGFALNVSTDLRYFDHIIPCGIQNKKVTSIKEELGREVDLEEVKTLLKKAFEEVFNVELVSDQKSFDK